MVLDENRRVTDQGPQYDCLLFDLDDTLHPVNPELAAASTNNIIDYMIQKLGFEKSKASGLRSELLPIYGTTLAGLTAKGFKIDYGEYHRFVNRGLPYNNLKPDSELNELLRSIHRRKIIFTNGDKAHAETVLNKLGLNDCFEDIICFETLNPLSEVTESSNELDMPTDNSTIPTKPTIPTKHIICKPSEEAMKQALSLANAYPQKTIFFDDSPRNIAAGKRAGLHTVLVGTSVPTEGADFAIKSIRNIREALPQI